MKLMGKAFVVALAAAATSIVACSSGPNPSNNDSSTLSGQNLGSVHLQFTLPSGQTVDTASYTVTNGINTYAGTINVAGSAQDGYTLVGVAPGSGYTLALTETTTDGTTSCAGTSAPFAVGGGTTTAVTIQLVCTAITDAGSITITPIANDCPTWNTVVANPASLTTTAPGNTSVITASATAPSPSQLSYTWTVTTGTGTLSNQSVQGTTSSTVTFTCPTTSESDVVTVVASDQTGAICPTADTTATVTIVCTAAIQPDAGGAVDSGSDAGTTDAGQDSSVVTPVDAGPLVPCTSPGQTGCVSCQGSSGGVCTATEAAFVTYDISAGYATVAGPDPAAGCYTCLVSKLALDATSNPLSGDLECDDLTGTGDTGSADCFATLDCIIGSSCATVATNVCYCGTQPVSGACSAAGGNGVCASQEAVGLGLPVTSGQAILEAYGTTTLSSGVANNIFQAGLSNGCTMCP